MHPYINMDLHACVSCILFARLYICKWTKRGGDNRLHFPYLHKALVHRLCGLSLVLTSLFKTVVLSFLFSAVGWMKSGSIGMVVGKEKKRGEVCKADCELARVGGILAPFHLMREGPSSWWWRVIFYALPNPATIFFQFFQDPVRGEERGARLLEVRKWFCEILPSNGVQWLEEGCSFGLRYAVAAEVIPGRSSTWKEQRRGRWSR